MADEIDDQAGMAGSEPEHAQTQTATPHRAAAADRGIPEDGEEAKRELEKTRKALAAANKEAADRRRKLEEYERREEEAKQEKLSETDRLKKIAAAERQKAGDLEQRAAAAERALVDTRIDHEVERAAAGLKFLYPQNAAKLIDRSLVEYDPETGKVSGAKKALELLLKEQPLLSEAHAGGGTPPRQGPRRPAEGYGPAAHPGQSRAPTIHEELVSKGAYSV